MRQDPDVWIALLPPDSPRVGSLRAEASASEGVYLLDIVWSAVTHVAVATVNGRDVGLAALGLDRLGEEMVPVIIGIWVKEAGRRNGIGTALVMVLARVSLDEHGAIPHIAGVTEAGLRTIDAARRAGAELIVDQWPS